VAAAHRHPSRTAICSRVARGKASVVTDTIARSPSTGKGQLRRGDPRDIVVTATGFNLSVFGDVAFTVDGEPVDFTQHLTWRGVMITACRTWPTRSTLPAQLDAAGRSGQDLVGRLLTTMQDKGATMVVPRCDPRTRTCSCGRSPTRETSTRLRHALAAHHVKQGDREPWTHMRSTTRSARSCQGGPRRRNARLPLSPAARESRRQRAPVTSATPSAADPVDLCADIGRTPLPAIRPAVPGPRCPGR